MQCKIVAELATGHGGDINLARYMVAAALDAGADYVKLQAYNLDRLNLDDPQANWLRQAHLEPETIASLADTEHLVVTPFDVVTLNVLRDYDVSRFKIASSEAAAGWWAPEPEEEWIVSYPWGQVSGDRPGLTKLTAIPLYPTPLECIGRAPLLDGWSDHTVGLDASIRAIALGARMVEVHFTLPGTEARRTAWDKSPDDIRLLRGFAERMETITSGVSQTFRDRWKA